jgi:hypothetical protein
MVVWWAPCPPSLTLPARQMVALGSRLDKALGKSFDTNRVGDHILVGQVAEPDDECAAVDGVDAVADILPGRPVLAEVAGILLLVDERSRQFRGAIVDREGRVGGPVGVTPANGGGSVTSFVRASARISAGALSENPIFRLAFAERPVLMDPRCLSGRVLATSTNAQIMVWAPIRFGTHLVERSIP